MPNAPADFGSTSKGQNMLTLRLLTAALIAYASLAHAQTAASTVDHDAHHPAAASAASNAAAMTDGEVRKIDKAQSKVTLKHGAIQNLDMPPMTTVFKVADPKMLEGLKDGDKVRFNADRVNGAITVTAIEPVAR